MGNLILSTKGDQIALKVNINVIQDNNPIVDLEISASLNQKLRGSINIPKGNPEQKPKAKTINNLGLKKAKKDSLQDFTY